MTYKYVCALALLCTLSINSLFAQEKNAQKAMLSISYQKNDNSNQREFLHLFRDEALQFDVADFLAKNKYKDVQIKGAGTIDNEKIKWDFEHENLETNCNKYVEYVSAVEKTPFLGVSVTATDDFSGAVVSQVITGSSAETYGLQIGDVITVINNFEISDPCEVTTAIGELAIGDIIDIDIVRQSENERLEALLGYRLSKTISWKQDCEQPTIALGNTPANIQDADLSVYPNPTGGIIQLKYSTTQKGAVQVNLTDFIGRIVLAKPVEKLSGLYEETLDLKGMQDGIYFLNVVQGEEVRTEKIVLQKG